MKLRRAKEYLLIRSCEEPQKFLEARTTFPHEADEAWYIPLHPGNLEERVKRHVGGKMNVPNPCESYLPRLIREYEEKLSRGEPLYQFVFQSYIYYETFEDEEEPDRPTYEHVESVPDSWPTVKEASKEKDIDKSTVNSQIYAGNLNAVMMNGRRYIEPTNDYEDWSPDRKQSYLRDRRLVIAIEVLEKYEPLHLKDLYSYIEEIEEKRFGPEQLPDSMATFFEEALEGVGGAPRSIWVWYNRIQKLSEFFDLDTRKKANRAFPDDILEGLIENAKSRDRESRSAKSHSSKETSHHRSIKS